MKQANKTIWLLDHIASSPDGMNTSQIIRDLWEHDNGVGTYTRERRGYWCTALYGGRAYHQGLLHFYCTKDPQTGRWVRNSVSHNGVPWGTMTAARRA